MTSLKAFLLPLALFATPLAVHAQEWREASRGDDRAARAVYWDGNCRVEQKIDRDGYLVERRRCRGDRAAYSRASRGYPDDPESDRAPRHASHRDIRPYEDAPAPVEPDEEPELVAVAVAVAPSMPAKAEPVEKTSRVFVNSDWLVTLETAPAKAAAPARAPVAGAGRTASLRQFEAYVMSKKSDPYSNLR